MIKEGKKAILYIRKSSEDQSNYSLADQEARLVEYCNRNGIIVLKKFREEYSAKDFTKRKVFMKDLIPFARKNRNEIDLLLVARWDRYSRGLTNALVMISKFQEEYNIETNCIEGWIDHSVPENLFMLSFYLAAPEVDNVKRAQNVIKGNRRANMLGFWVRKAPLGYMNSRDESNKPIILPDLTKLDCGLSKAQLIKNLWLDFASGIFGMEELRHKYYKLGINMSKSRIGQLLRSEFYMGKIRLNDWNGEKGGLFDGKHEGLISEEVFNKVQQILEGRKPNRISTKIHEELPLRGLVKCSCCDEVMTGSLSRGRNGERHAYYHGKSRTGCKERIRADKLNDQVLDMISRIKPTKEIVELYLEILNEKLSLKAAIERDDQLEANNKINALEMKLEGIEEKYMSDKISDEVYRKWNLKISKEISQLKDKLIELSAIDDDTLTLAEKGLPVLSNLANYFKNGTPKLKKHIIGSIFMGDLLIEQKEFVRTINFHPVIAYLCGKTKKRPSSKGRFLDTVGLTGFEPVTPCL